MEQELYSEIADLCRSQTVIKFPMLIYLFIIMELAYRQ